MCVVTEELCEKRRSQIGHRNGFWPEKMESLLQFEAQIRW